LLDAQALGIPIVATRVGGIPDVIEDGVNGRLVPARDPRALAQALIEALGDEPLRRRWVERGRETVKGFGIDHTVTLTRSEYSKVLGERA
jgi:glycosyltransferase involved in cell wall biosynthesis